MRLLGSLRDACRHKRSLAVGVRLFQNVIYTPFPCRTNTQLRCLTGVATHFYQEKDRYSVKDLSLNRLWTEVAGIDPQRSVESQDLWNKYCNIVWHAYLHASFDLGLPWMAQEPKKKVEAREYIKAEVQKNESLRNHSGLQNVDLLSWRLYVFHMNRRSYLRRLMKGAGLGERSQYLPEIIEAFKTGQVHMLKKPQLEEMQKLAQQGARLAFSRIDKRRMTNETNWRKHRSHFVHEPHDPEKDRQVIAQAPSKHSASASRRWQKWREALRNGDIPSHTRIRSDEARRKTSESLKKYWSQRTYTPGMFELRWKLLDENSIEVANNAI